MSLLDDVSIVVTPNGYKAGELYAVVPVPTEGAEEVTNGDFATDSDWSKATGVTISGGNAIFNNSTANNNGIYQAAVFQTNTQYKITAEVSNYSSGNVTAWSGSSQNSTSNESFTGNGTKTWIISTGASNGYLILSSATTNGNFNIDNVSVKEYTASDMDVTRATAATRVDEDGLVNYAEIIGDELVTDGNFPSGTTAWTFGAGWSMGDDKVIGVNATGNLEQSISFTNGGVYKISFTISDYVSGQVRLQTNVQNSIVVSANGTYTEFLTMTTDNNLLFNGIDSNSFTGSIDNISVKEVTKDNVPRIDYTGGGCPHILAEPQRTNLIAYSERLSSTTNVTSSSTISPDGTLNGLKLNETTGNSQHYSTSYGGAVVDDGTIYTISFYIKKGTYDSVLIYTQSSKISASINITFSTESTVVGGSDLISGSNFMEDAGNGWYRVGFSATAHSTGEVSLYLSPKDLSTYAGDISQYTEYWGMQIEAGSYPTSYIPNFGTSAGVTRNQDTFTRDGIGSLINSTEGVLFVEMAALSNDASYRYIGLTDGSSDNRVVILYYNSNNKIRVLLSSGSTKYFDEYYAVTSVEDFHKVAVKWKVNDFAVWIDGEPRATATSGSAPIGLNTLALDQANASNWFGKIKQLQVYNTALTDAQLTSLTS